MSRSWHNGFFDCFSGNWLLGWCCPCVLYSRNVYRLEHQQDLALAGASSVNGDCLAWYALAICTCSIGQAVLQMGHRAKTRQRLGLPADQAGDFLGAWCCHCCSLIQEEEELKLWQAGAPPYAAQAGMQYQPQQQAYPPQGYPGQKV